MIQNAVVQGTGRWLFLNSSGVKAVFQGTLCTCEICVSIFWHPQFHQKCITANGRQKDVIYMLHVVGAKMQTEITPTTERARKVYCPGGEQGRLGNIIFLLQLAVTLYISGELGSCC